MIDRILPANRKAEGLFYIKNQISRTGNKDDRALLDYLCARLNIGLVYPKDTNSANVSSTWEVTKINDLMKYPVPPHKSGGGEGLKF